MNLQAWLYNLIRGALSQDQRGRIKRSQQRLRNRAQWFYKTRYGTFSADDLRRELDRRIGGEFEILMLHSAFDGMTPMYRGSVLELKSVMIDLCGPGRTLVMPAFFFGGADFDPVRYYREKPLFDLRRTPSQMGLLTELFRRHPGVTRSLHPTYSICALGPLAAELAGEHHLDPHGCGAESPFGVMDRRRTTIVGIGLPYYRCLTHVHHVEHVLGTDFPVPFREETVDVVLVDGEKNRLGHELRVKVFDRPRKIEKLERFVGPQDLRTWRFHGVPMFAVSAHKITAALLERAKNGITIYSG